MIKNNKGFNLFTLTILVFSVGLLMATTLRFYEFASIKAKTIKTFDKLNAIEDALKNFVIENKRFPCPAPINCNNNNCVNKGKEVRNGDGSCDSDGAGIFSSINSSSEDIYYGAVPTYTLNLSKDIGADEWHNKIVYMIPKNLTEDDSIQLFLSDKNGSGSITSNKEYIKNGALFVLMSYNRIRSGAFPDNSKMANSFSESENKPKDGFTVNLDDKKLFTIYKNYKNFSLGGIEEDLAECPELSTVYLDETFTFPKSSVGEIVFSNEECPLTISNPPLTTDHYYISTFRDIEGVLINNHPAKVCGKNGQWQDGYKYTCELLDKCAPPPPTVNGFSREWNQNYRIVNMGKVTDKSGIVKLKCLVDYKGTTSWFQI